MFTGFTPETIDFLWGIRMAFTVKVAAASHQN